MMTIVRNGAPLTLMAGLVVGCAFSQQAQKSASEKHVKDIRAEQTQQVISASTLCQQVRANGHSTVHRLEVNPVTLEPTLALLMQKSSEVVLASTFRDEIDALSPSREDVIEYYDVTILQTWKGSSKVGDLLTFALPRGGVYCGLNPIPGGAVNAAAVTMTGGFDWQAKGSGPYVLFLRQAKGEERQLTPGLRLAGGDGLQGLFVLKFKFDNDCSGAIPRNLPKCSAILRASKETVKVQYRFDPLKEQVESMAVPTFLEEVQSVADSLGYVGQGGLEPPPIEAMSYSLPATSVTVLRGETRNAHALTNPHRAD